MAASTVSMMAASAPSVAAFSKSELAGTTIAGGLPSLSFKSNKQYRLTVQASGGKKIQTATPLGPSGDNKYRDGKDASGSPAKGKGVYQFTNKYGANVDGYSPIFTPEEWSPNGDVYAGGVTGLLLWAVTLGGVLLGGVLLVYYTSALAQ